MKRMKQILCSILALALVLSMLTVSVQAASSSSVISTALSQIEYTERTGGYSKYGQWYGVPYGAWCDMFVSWCAYQAGLPASVFPRSASCTAHIRAFSQRGAYHISAARGGAYVPRQGDLMFLYDYNTYPRANVACHVGLVLCVENGYVFTIEGNTVTNRLDYSYYDEMLPKLNFKLLPTDYVAVNCHPLNEKRIHGYAVPNYTNRTALAHDGWVDLGKYESLRGTFRTLASQGIMAETSSYTFSPRFGMTRGDFLTALMKLYGLSGWEADTQPFADVPQGAACYNAVMAAKSAGIVNGTGSNMFKPNIYISGLEAQALISRTLAYVGLENRSFSFSAGDYSSVLTPYTIRADIAKALYALLSELPKPTVPQEQLTLNSQLLDWHMLMVSGSIYVPLEAVQQLFPELSPISQETNQAVRLPVPMTDIDRVLLSKLTYQYGGKTAAITTFTYHGTQYIMLHPAANLLDVTLVWRAGSSVIELYRETSNEAEVAQDISNEMETAQDTPKEIEPPQIMPVLDEPQNTASEIAAAQDNAA